MWLLGKRRLGLLNGVVRRLGYAQPPHRTALPSAPPPTHPALGKGECQIKPDPAQTTPAHVPAQVFEEVEEADAITVPYTEVREEQWAQTAVLSWRWGMPKPTVYRPGFSPMTVVQFTELRLLLHRLSAAGFSLVWIDWWVDGWVRAGGRRIRGQAALWGVTDRVHRAVMARLRLQHWHRQWHRQWHRLRPSSTWPHRQSPRPRPTTRPTARPAHRSCVPQYKSSPMVSSQSLASPMILG